MYDFQNPSTNTSLKSGSALQSSVEACTPSRRVVDNILHIAKVECAIIRSGRKMQERNCFQQINIGDTSLRICLN